MKFIDRLVQSVRQKQTPLMVGLDPHFDLLPDTCRTAVTASLDTSLGRAQAADVCCGFCCDVLDAIAPMVPAVKPQLAFFERWGPAGMQALRRVVDRAHAWDLCVILDGKRNDIGSTAQAYAEAMLGRGELSGFGGDALTVNPWLGADSLTPFVQRCQAVESGLFVLVKTSNPGSRDVQDLQTARGTCFEIVAEQVQRLAQATIGQSNYGDIGAVVGATFPDELASLRQRMLNTWFLIPGYGAQGADARSVAAAFDGQGLGAIVNSSRNIIFAFRTPRGSPGGTRWQDVVRDATQQAIDDIANSTAAGTLRRHSPAVAPASTGSKPSNKE